MKRQMTIYKKSSGAPVVFSTDEDKKHIQALEDKLNQVEATKLQLLRDQMKERNVELKAEDPVNDADISARYMGIVNDIRGIVLKNYQPDEKAQIIIPENANDNQRQFLKQWNTGLSQEQLANRTISELIQGIATPFLQGQLFGLKDVGGAVVEAALVELETELVRKAGKTLKYITIFQSTANDE